MKKNLQIVVFALIFSISNMINAQSPVCGPQWFFANYDALTVTKAASFPATSPNILAPGTTSVSGFINNTNSFVKIGNVNSSNVTQSYNNNDYVFIRVTVPTNSPDIRITRFQITNVHNQAFNIAVSIFNQTDSILSNQLASLNVAASPNTNGSAVAVNLTSAYILKAGKTYQFRMYVSRSDINYSSGSGAQPNEVLIDNPQVFGAYTPLLNNDYALIPCPASVTGFTKTQMDAFVSTTTPAGYTIRWFRGTTYVSSNFTPGTYTAYYYNTADGCYLSPGSTTIRVVKELCLETPPVQTVFANSQVNRSLDQLLQPSGGNGEYVYSIPSGTGAEACNAPSSTTYPGIQALPSGSNLVIGAASGPNTASYTAPSTPGYYYYCVKVRDTDNPQQFKIGTVIINVVAEPVFNCDQSMYVSSYDGAKTYLYRSIINNTNPVSMEKVDSDGTPNTEGYTGQLYNIAYNSADNYIYGVSETGHLIRFNARGEAADLSTASTPITLSPSLPPGPYKISAFGPDNNLYLFQSGTSIIYRINVTNGVVSTVTLNQSVNTGDLAWSVSTDPYENGLRFHGYDHTVQKLFTIEFSDPANIAAATNAEVVYNSYAQQSTVNPTNEIGAMYVGGLGKVFGIDGSTGKIYNFLTATGDVYEIAHFDTTSTNFINGIKIIDGAHCKAATIRFTGNVSVLKENLPLPGSNFTPGTQHTFKITVTNDGPFGVNDVSVFDVMSVAGAEVVSTTLVSASNAYSEFYDVGVADTTYTDFSDIVRMQPGGSLVYEVTFSIPLNYVASTLTNEADIDIPGYLEDSNVGDNVSIITINSAACFKPAATGQGLESKIGITSFNRAGEFKVLENGQEITLKFPEGRRGAHLVLESETKGFVINRVDATSELSNIAQPKEGMVIFDKEANCLKIYIGTEGSGGAWKCLTTLTCPQ